MNGMMQSVGLVAALSALLVSGSPASAGSSDAVFYELIEEATFVFDGAGQLISRTGTGGLAGETRTGPLCPRALITRLEAAGLASRGTACYVTAWGTDVLSGTTFAGSLEADIAVKVQGDNPVDAPELVVLRAHVSGRLVVADPELRLLAITDGTLRITEILDPTFTLVPIQGGTTAFTGTVRLPFVPARYGYYRYHRKARRFEAAYYLGDRAQLIPVQPEERSLGLPTARFELRFAD